MSRSVSRMHSPAALFAGAALCAALAGPAGAKTIYVDDGAPTGGTGATWPKAFKYLQNALAVAAAGDEIRVGQGSYKPDQSEGGLVTPGDRKASFQLKSGVALRGGYAGFGAADPDKRDIALYKTTLTGDLAGNDGAGFDYTKCAENSYHVVIGSGAAATALLEGFTVRSGTANGYYPNDRGAGILVLGGAPSIAECTITKNWTPSGDALSSGGPGGGVFCGVAANLSLRGCLITDNRTGDSDMWLTYQAGSGGGLYAEKCSVSLIQCSVKMNKAGVPDGDGGGIYLKNATAIVSGSQISENKTGQPSAMSSSDAGDGGGLFVYGSSLDISASVISGNTAGKGGDGQDGGAGGGLYCSLSTLTVVNSGINGNFSGDGGGITGSGGDGGAGGGIYCDSGCTLDMRGSEVRQNKTGAGAWKNGAGGPGAGIYGAGASLALRDTTIADNVTGPGADTSSGPVPQGGPGGNGGGLWGGSNSTVAMVGCCLEGNQTGKGGAGLSGGSGGNGAGVFCDGPKSVTTLSTIFRRNMTGDGGDASSSLWFGPGQGGSGAGVCTSGGPVVLVNCLLDGNQTGFEGNDAYGKPGDQAWGAAVAGTGLTLVNCTVASNKAVAVYASGAPGHQVSNCVLWANDGPAGLTESSQIAGPCSVDFSCVQGWTGGLGGLGNFGDNPLFIDLLGPDGQPGTGDEDLRVGGGSPCIDAGINSAVPPDIFDLDDNTVITEPVPLDLAGCPRFIDDPETVDTGSGSPPLVDVGCYEYQATFVPIPLLLVSSRQTNSVLAFGGSDGQFIRVLLDASDGLDYPNGLAADGDGNLYVASVGTNNVIKCTLRSGAVLLKFSGGGLLAPDGLLLHQSKLLVASYSTDSIKQYDPSTGAYIKDLVLSGSGGLDGPAGLAHTLDGDVLVASQPGSRVLKFDGQTGAYLGVAAQGGGLDGPEDVLLDDSGNLLVAGVFSKNVVRYAPGGQFLDEFVKQGSGGLSGASGLGWGLDGQLLVTDRYGESVLQYDGDDGSPLGVFAVGGGLDEPTHLLLVTLYDPDCNQNGTLDQWDIDLGVSTDVNHNGVPDECEPLGDLNCDGQLDAFDIDPFVLALTNPAGYKAKYPDCEIMRADINGDSKVDAFDIDPFVKLLTGG